MTTKYYACFAMNDGPTNLVRELGSVVEIDEQVGSLLSKDDVAEMLADNFDVNPASVVVYHWSRIH